MIIFFLHSSFIWYNFLSFVYECICLLIRGSHTWSACNLPIKWPSQNDVPSIKMQNLNLFMNILSILYLYNICWCTLQNYMNPYYLALMTCSKWNQPGIHSLNSSCWELASSTFPNDHQSCHVSGLFLKSRNNKSAAPTKASFTIAPFCKDVLCLTMK